jgi:hypothetical protein
MDRRHSQRLGMTREHINLHGEYDFPDEKMLDSVGLAGPKNQPLPMG